MTIFTHEIRNPPHSTVIRLQNRNFLRLSQNRISGCDFCKNRIQICDYWNRMRYRIVAISSNIVFNSFITGFFVLLRSPVLYFTLTKVVCFGLWRKLCLFFQYNYCTRSPLHYNRKLHWMYAVFASLIRKLSALYFFRSSLHGNYCMCAPCLA